MSSAVKKEFLIREKNIPHRLRAYPHWLMWHYERADGDKPGAKLRKVPYYPDGQKRSGVIGSDKDVARLGTFREAIEAAKTKGFDGVGLAILPVQDITVIDLDDCISDTGVYSDFANELIEHGSYVERSPSGRGLRAVYDGSIIEDAKQNFHIDNGERVEVYCGKAYTTFTGNKLPSIELDDIQALPRGIKKRLLKGMGDRATASSSEGDGGGLASMNAIALPNMTLGQAAKVLAGLPKEWGSNEDKWWRVMAAAQLQFGKTEEVYAMLDEWLQTHSGYSEAGNRKRWDSGFSHAHGKQKITSMRNLVFETIDEAKRTNKKQIRQDILESWGLGRSAKKAKPLDDDLDDEVDDDIAAAWEKPVDLTDWADLSERPKGATPLVRNWLYEGTVCLFASHGGGGKSYISLLFMAKAATGGVWFGQPMTQGGVLYVSGEDPVEEVKYRLYGLCESNGINRADIPGSLDIIDVVPVLHKALYEGSDFGKAEFTKQYGLLKALVESGKYKYLFLDNLAKFYMANENARPMVDEFVSALAAIAMTHGVGVVLIGHVPKPKGGAEDAAGYSGSTAWHNSARTRWMLVVDRASGISELKVEKNNYGETGHGGKFRYDKAQNAYVMGETSGEGSATSEFADQAFDDAVRAGVHHVRSLGGHVPTKTAGPLGDILVNPGVVEMLENVPVPERPGRIRAALRRLESAGEIIRDTYKTKNRNTLEQYILSSNIDPING